VREILPGVHHWTAIHPNIRIEVSSYWLEDGGVLIDPLVPPDAGVEWFAARPTPPTAVVLSNRHHYRHSARFGVPVYCIRAGLHEFGADRPVTAFDFGDELAGGLVAHEIGALCPDDTALHLPAARAVFFADGVVKGSTEDDQPLGFVPDSLMDDPPGTKRGLLDAFARVLEELDFDHVLLAHGGPVLNDGRARLQELVDAGGRTAFEF
jgi:glyoxylase-like metal-dependent hydrolase (beta-lactamase superfamily II)